MINEKRKKRHPRTGSGLVARCTPKYTSNSPAAKAARRRMRISGLCILPWIRSRLAAPRT